MESSYIDLVQDLLNKDTDPQSRALHDRLWKHIALEPPRGVQRLVPVICSSPALWHSSFISWDAVLSIFSTLVKGTLAKAQLIKQEAGTGWFAHRTMRQFVNDIIQSLTEQQNNEQNSSHALSRIIVLSAIHVGLRSLLTRPFALDPNRNGILNASENALLELWSFAANNGHLELSSPLVNRNDGKIVPMQYIACWLASQTLVGVSTSEIHRVPPIPFVQTCISTLCFTFDEGTLFDGVDDDLVEATDGLAWRENSASKKLLKDISQSRLFLSLSFLSRLIGKVIETVRSPATLSQLLPELNRLKSLCLTIFSSWKKVRWSKISDPAHLDPSTRSDKVPWTIFKTLLFSCTMIHASAVSLLSSIPNGTKIDSPNFQILNDIASCTIETFSPLQFIASQFGNDGSGLLQYKALWHGALDFIKLGGSRSIIKTIQTIEPPPTVSRAYYRDIHPLDRGKDAYFLNVAEEWIPFLADEYIEWNILTNVVTPYREGPSGTDAFEACHSVILSIFVHAKPCAYKILPWYTEFLIKNTSNALTPRQMRIGFAGAVKYASSVEDHLAWFCINRLCEEIDSSMVVRKIASDANEIVSVNSNKQEDQDEQGDNNEDSKTNDANSMKEASTSNSTGTKADDDASGRGDKKASRHRTIMFMLIDQCGTVNSSLFPALLTKIQGYIKGIDDINERLVLSRSLFATLNGGVDSSKRLQAATWWVENGKDLIISNKETQRSVEERPDEQQPEKCNEKEEKAKQEEDMIGVENDERDKVKEDEEEEKEEKKEEK